VVLGKKKQSDSIKKTINERSGRAFLDITGDKISKKLNQTRNEKGKGEGRFGENT